MKKALYKPQAVPTTISASASTTLKIRDNYFKMEVHEERSISAEAENVDMDKEWHFLFDELNTILDDQVDELYNNLKSS